MKKILLISALLSLVILIFNNLENTETVKYMYSDNFGHYFVKENNTQNETIFISNEKLKGEFSFNNTYKIKIEK